MGRNDQHKLDEYLNGVREVERRIERTDEELEVSVDVDYPIPKGMPEDYGEHIRLMCDMMVLAFQTDRTRIATFMFADAGSNRSYRHIDVADGHHDLSHHRRRCEEARQNPQDQSLSRRAAFVPLAEAEVDARWGDGNLLDNSMICYGSAISDGDRHNNENLPILLAGMAAVRSTRVGTFASPRKRRCAICSCRCLIASERRSILSATAREGFRSCRFDEDTRIRRA